MKEKIITISFVIYIFLFGIFGIIIKDEKISFSERRQLTTFPEYKMESDYIKNVDKYFLDHFPFRENFRSIKASFNYNILNMYDNNGIYIKDNYIFKSEYPTDEKSISNFIEKTNKIKSLLTEDNKTYLMIVPDKNYYLEDKNFLQIDYNYLYNSLNKLDMTKIDLRNTLNLYDYYETDTHFKQQNLDKVVFEMSKAMDFSYQEIDYKENIYNNFYGVYYGRSSIKRKPEKLIYLENNIINSCYVNYLENTNFHEVYNKNKLNSLDSYEVYLDGASSFIEIYNYNNDSNKELVIFRDSFASSLTPLLINYYSKITLIDNRYISSENFLNYIEFNNQDILFIYSTLVINNSGTLKG